MKAREELIKEKVENLKSSKNLTEKDLQIDIMSSHEKIRRRGRHYFEYKKPFDYGNTEQYKSNKEQHPSFSPGPTHYWKDRLKEFDTNTRPKDVVEDTSKIQEGESVPKENHVEPQNVDTEEQKQEDGTIPENDNLQNKSESNTHE